MPVPLISHRDHAINPLGQTRDHALLPDGEWVMEPHGLTCTSDVDEGMKDFAVVANRLVNAALAIVLGFAAGIALWVHRESIHSFLTLMVLIGLLALLVGGVTVIFHTMGGK
jgi:hypothetical protein